MCDFKTDINELIDILQKSKDHRNAFNKKYNEHIQKLIHRYDEVTGGYTQRGKSGILAFSDGNFKIQHDGYEGKWIEEYPIELLTDISFIESLELEQRKRIAERKEQNKQEELKQLEKLKAKYEN